MEIKNELGKELKDKQLGYNQKIKEAKEIDAKPQIIFADINDKKRRFGHKKSILDDLNR